MNIISDLANQTPIKESFRNRMRESGEKLKWKAEEKIDRLMEGSGYKYKRSFGELQSLHNFVPSSTGKRKPLKKKARKKKQKVQQKQKPKKKKVSKQKKEGKRTLKDIFDQ